MFFDIFFLVSSGFLFKFFFKRPEKCRESINNIQFLHLQSVMVSLQSPFHYSYPCLFTGAKKFLRHLSSQPRLNSATCIDLFLTSNFFLCTRIFHWRSYSQFLLQRPLEDSTFVFKTCMGNLETAKHQCKYYFFPIFELFFFFKSTGRIFSRKPVEQLSFSRKLSDIFDNYTSGFLPHIDILIERRKS